MQIEKILMPHEVIKGKEIPMNSIVLRLDNKSILVCSKFNHSRKQNLELLVWLPAQKKWVRTYAKNEYTEIMWDYYRKHQQKRKCGLSKEIKSNDENRKHRQPQVTPEKEEMIREAFKHFNLIYVS